MGMNSIGIIPGHVLNLHPAPLLPAMYRYFHACLFFLPGRSHSLSTQWPSNKQSKQAPNSSSSQPTSHPASEPTNQPTNRFPATHSLSSLMSLATHSLNPPAQSIRSSLRVVALSTDASFSPSHSFPQSRHASSRLARCPFTLPAFIGVQNPSQL